MGKRIEDLRQLNDTPIGAGDHERDERDEPWYEFIGEIDALLTTGEVDWAFASLTGIRETVEASRRVSEGQRRAVANIDAAAQRRRR